MIKQLFCSVQLEKLETNAIFSQSSEIQKDGNTNTSSSPTNLDGNILNEDIDDANKRNVSDLPIFQLN